MSTKTKTKTAHKTPIDLTYLPYYLYQQCATNRAGHPHLLPEGWMYTDYADYAFYRWIYRGEG